jgi:hypothetical protein
MNHGIVCWEGDGIGSRLWNMAVAKGQFVALYTSRGFAEGGPEWMKDWFESFVPRSGDPLMLGHYEYARYEPGYDQPFQNMCLKVFNKFATVAVPSASDDSDAMTTLTAFEAVSSSVRMRFFGDRNDQRKRSERRLRDLIQPTPLRGDWAYLLGFFYPKPVTVLLTMDAADIDSFETVDPDRYFFKVLERW